MKKRGKFVRGFVIIIILILVILILKSGYVTSQSFNENNLSIKQTIDKNLKFNVKPAQVARVGYGGGPRFVKESKKSDETLKEVIPEAVENRLEETTQENQSEKIKQQNQVEES